MALVALALLTACGGQDEPDRRVTSSTASPSASPEPTAALFPAVIGAKYGYIDATGKVVIRPAYEQAMPFSEGLAAVRIRRRWGYVDPSGRLVVRPRYEAAEPFSDGVALVTSRSYEYLFIDSTGAVIMRARAAEIFSFREGLAAASAEGAYGYVDKNGAFVIDAQYDDAAAFSEGLAAVSVDGRWGFVDKTGRMAIEPQFGTSYGTRFSEGLAAVKSGGSWGYIDTRGSFAVEPAFREAGPFADGLAPVRVGRKWGYIDHSGELVVEPAYQMAEPFSNGRGLVQKKGRFGFVDAGAREIIPPQYGTASSFENGLAALTVLGQPGYVDPDGTAIWPRASSATLPQPVARARLAISRDGDIWTARGDGRHLDQVTRGRLDDGQPAWSPDGKTIAFVRRSEGGSSAICLVSITDEKVRTLIRRAMVGRRDDAFIGGICWSPDGDRIAWGETSTGGSNEVSRIVTVDVEAGTTAELLSKENGFGAIDAGWSPSWSPDGERLLIAQSGMDAEGGQTWVLTPATGDLRRLPIADAAFSVWSPDGSLILTTTTTQETSSIRLLPVDGRRARVLARGGGWEGPPSLNSATFSPDGKWIVYTKGGTGLWVMRVDGDDQRGLMDGSSADWR